MPDSLIIHSMEASNVIIFLRCYAPSLILMYQDIATSAFFPYMMLEGLYAFTQPLNKVKLHLIKHPEKYTMHVRCDHYV